ncbi:hypothetical protein ACFPIJ_35555 [Dactylosporangium cerinum]|uniref:Uncharacterized protein n=1 Tax=Dactylosporangium cerinum TaxID=1434730 RepID=A0ABV9W7R2_9ACTN
MGTSYQTLLVAAAIEPVCDALNVAGVDAIALPAAANRTAVIPREGALDFADPGDLAERIGAGTGWATLANVVEDSDWLQLEAYLEGRFVHRYRSDRPAPDDAARLAPFGTGEVDTGRLGKALRGEFEGSGPVYAEFQHRLILNALHLDPRGLTTAFRWADTSDLPNAIRINP